MSWSGAVPAQSDRFDATRHLDMEHLKEHKKEAFRAVAA
jgi:hypothetical protein